MQSTLSQQAPAFDRFYFHICAVLLSVFLIAGILFCFLLPPFQVPDESAHWQSSYARSSALLRLEEPRSNGCSFANALPEHFETSRIVFRSHEKVGRGRFFEISGMKRECAAHDVSYGFALTYPGTVLGRLLVGDEERSPRQALRLYYVARLVQGSLVFFVLLRGLFVWRRSARRPAGVASLIAFSLCPLVLQQSFALSADTVLLALGLQGAFAVVLWRDFSGLDRASLLALCVVGAISKPPFFPFVVVVASAILFGNFFGAKEAGERRRLLTWLGATIVAALAGAFWILSLDHTPPAGQIGSRNIDIPAQVSHVLSNPLEVFGVVTAAFHSHLVQPMSGWRLGWLDTELLPAAIRSFRGLLIGALCLDLLLSVWRYRTSATDSFRGLIIRRIPGAALFAGCYATGLIVVLAVYVFWTEVGLRAVEGLQLRHLIPVVMLFPFCAVLTLVPSENEEIRPQLTSRKLPRLAAAGRSLLLCLTGYFALQYIYGVSLTLLTRYW